MKNFDIQSDEGIDARFKVCLTVLEELHKLPNTGYRALIACVDQIYLPNYKSNPNTKKIDLDIAIQTIRDTFYLLLSENVISSETYDQMISYGETMYNECIKYIRDVTPM